MIPTETIDARLLEFYQAENDLICRRRFFLFWVSYKKDRVVFDFCQIGSKWIGIGIKGSLQILKLSWYFIFLFIG